MNKYIGCNDAVRSMEDSRSCMKKVIQRPELLMHNEIYYEMKVGNGVPDTAR